MDSVEGTGFLFYFTLTLDTDRAHAATGCRDQAAP